MSGQKKGAVVDYKRAAANDARERDEPFYRPDESSRAQRAREWIQLAKTGSKASRSDRGSVTPVSTGRNAT